MHIYKFLSLSNIFSLSRRPIPPRSRRPRYNKPSSTHSETNLSDEGNTSEYSVTLSSKSSTLDSNSGRGKKSLQLPLKRPINSDGTSDSESDDNATIATQVNLNFEDSNRNPAESVV